MKRWPRFLSPEWITVSPGTFGQDGLPSGPRGGRRPWPLHAREAEGERPPGRADQGDHDQRAGRLELLAPVERAERGDVGDARPGQARGILGLVAGVDAAPPPPTAQRTAQAGVAKAVVGDEEEPFYTEQEDGQGEPGHQPCEQAVAGDPPPGPR